jgi:RND family efflux transporter MFP subunit
VHASETVARRLLPIVVLGLLAASCGRDQGSLRLVGGVERTLLELVAPVSEVVVAIPVARGQRVEAGEPVVQLDPALADAEVAQAEAAVAAARTGSAVAVIDLERAQKLRSDRVASQQDLDRARLAHDEAVARLREARAALVAARKRRADLALTAPAAAVVDQLPYQVGERVPAGAVLAVLMDDSDPWVRVWIPETSFARVAPGTPATIRIDGIARALHGSVIDVAREPEFTPHYALTERERVHLVYETRVRILDAPPALRPGVRAEVELFAPAADAAPSEAAP